MDSDGFGRQWLTMVFKIPLGFLSPECSWLVTSSWKCQMFGPFYYA